MDNLANSLDHDQAGQITFANSLDSDQTGQNVEGLIIVQNYLTMNNLGIRTEILIKLILKLNKIAD